MCTLRILSVYGSVDDRNAISKLASISVSLSLDFKQGGHMNIIEDNRNIVLGEKIEKLE